MWECAHKRRSLEGIRSAGARVTDCDGPLDMGAENWTWLPTRTVHILNSWAVTLALCPEYRVIILSRLGSYSWVQTISYASASRVAGSTYVYQHILIVTALLKMWVGFCFVWEKRQDLAMQSRLVLNLGFSCFNLLSSEIRGVCHHAWPL